MQKTKLGVTVALFGAAIYFISLFGGYVPVIILGGYVLLMEENVWLKKAAVKSVAVLTMFALFSSLLNLIPGVISFVDDIFNIFGGYFTIGVVSAIVNMLTSALSLLRTLLFILLGLKALNQGDISVPGIDKLVNKCFEA